MNTVIITLSADEAAMTSGFIGAAIADLEKKAAAGSVLSKMQMDILKRAKTNIDKGEFQE